MRISDWSSDVCSSDLNFQCLRSVVGFDDLMSEGRKLGHHEMAKVGIVFHDEDRRAGCFLHCMFGWTCYGCSQVWLRRSEEHTSELQSLMRLSYAVFCLKKKITSKHTQHSHITTSSIT